LENLVTSKSETELRRWSHDTRWTALEEGLEALLLPDPLCAVTKTIVRGLTLSRLDLQTRLDDVAWCGEVGRRHTSNSTGSQHLKNTQLLLCALAKEVFLEMAVWWEVDGRERNFSCQRRILEIGEGHTVTQKTSGSTLVQANETKISNDPHSRSLWNTFDILRKFTLDL
jgi:hypothetical protein